MYPKHFGFTGFVFNNDIPTDEMYPSAGITEAGVRLHHLVELRGIGLITGDSGSGKSSACRRFCGQLHAGLYKVVYIPLSTGNPMDMYKSIAWEFGLPTERNRAALYRQIRSEVTRLCTEARQRPVLIVDEAQFLRSDVLEELRLLTNYAMDSDNRLCLLLCGQSELRRRIGMAVHESLHQRVIVRYQMPPLTRDEFPDYLAHLLRRVGCEVPVFAPAAIEALYQASQGLPRKIGLYGHHALLAAALAKAKLVTPEHVQAALVEAT
jgi:type II secretory pathway predicted ATPase ExeA